MRSTVLVFPLVVGMASMALAGPYAPPAGQPGSTAIANSGDSASLATRSTDSRLAVWFRSSLGSFQQCRRWRRSGQLRGASCGGVSLKLPLPHYSAPCCRMTKSRPPIFAHVTGLAGLVRRQTARIDGSHREPGYWAMIGSGLGS